MAPNLPSGADATAPEGGAGACGGKTTGPFCAGGGAACVPGEGVPELPTTRKVIGCDEAPPASLFELPPDLRKFNPEALIERIKHSDVWVPGSSDKAASHP